MQEIQPDLVGLLRIFEQANVRFVLIGGLAMVAHGSDYITRDVDVIYSREPDNLAALVAALKPLHPRLRGVPEDLPFIFDVRTFKNDQNLTLVTDMGSVDLLGEAPGADSFDKLWERATVLEIEGMVVHVASVDDLIAMKMAADRPKDQLHVMELRALRELKAEYHTS